VIQGVEPASDEGVIEGADRQQGLTVELARETESAQEQEQVVLGDAELDVLAGRRLLPLDRLRHVGERV